MFSWFEKLIDPYRIVPLAPPPAVPETVGRYTGARVGSTVGSRDGAGVVWTRVKVLVK